MTPGTYNIPDQYAGDTCSGYQVEIDRDGVPVDLTGCAIKVQMKLRPSEELSLTLTNGTGISILNEEGGVFRLGPFSVPIKAGISVYDLQIKDTSDQITTYLRGSMKVLTQVTM